MMRNLIFTILFFLSLSSHAQEYSAIKGFVKNDRLKEVTFYKTVDGNIQACATSQVAPDGSYGFLLRPEPGFYSIGEKWVNFPLYLQGGEEVNIDLYRTQAKLNGKNTPENETLYRWVDYAANIRTKAVFFDQTLSNYEDFFPDFGIYLKGLPDVRKKLKSGNAAFDRLLAEYVDYSTDFYALLFLATPRDKHPEKSMWPEYYKHIASPQKYTTDVVLQFPEGVRMLGVYAEFANRESGEKERYNPDDVITFLHNDRLVGEYLLNNEFRRYRSYEQYSAGMEKYGKYFVTPSLKARAEALGAPLYDTKAGSPAADFTYPDVEGNRVSLSDFKGKVVLVDVWATWCGPCRKEISHLKNLEKEMHGTDVVFLGVSVDEAKDKQKWLDFIETEGLKGIQLLANGWSKITKDYKINGIPRFMVFDKKGNIVSVDAPRPSNPELKKMLEAELNK